MASSTNNSQRCNIHIGAAVVTRLLQQLTFDNTERRFKILPVLQFNNVMLLLLKITWAIAVLTFCEASLSRQKRIVGGYPALVPEATGFTISQPARKPDNIIFIQDDYRTATITGIEEPEGYNAYKGIRYAEPPVGRLRFQVRCSDEQYTYYIIFKQNHVIATFKLFQRSHIYR